MSTPPGRIHHDGRECIVSQRARYALPGAAHASSALVGEPFTWQKGVSVRPTGQPEDSSQYEVDRAGAHRCCRVIRPKSGLQKRRPTTLAGVVIV